MVGNAVPAYHSDEVFGCVSRQRGLVKLRIAGNEMIGRRVDIGEIAAPAPRNPDLFPGFLVLLKDDNRSAAPAGLDGAHQTRRAGADDHYVVRHVDMIWENPKSRSHR